jgi:hypothetical protein
MAAAWTVGTMVAAASPAVSAEETLGSRSPAALTVTIHVADYASLPHMELDAAEAHATAAFRAAGIDIVWSSAPWKPEPRQSADPRSIDVRLVIVPRDMAEKKCRLENLGASVLGISISGASEARGRVAYVFYDRIARVARAHHAPVVRGLGHVMAHEVGHLLMGVDSHADDGLMRAGWDPRESRTQTFTTSQVQQIRRRSMAALGKDDR